MDTLFPFTFSNTMLSGTSCELRWFRNHCQRLSNTRRNSDLIAGGHFAKGCETVRNLYYNEGKTLEEAVAKATTDIIEGEDTGDQLKSNDRVALALSKYFQRYPLDGNLTPCKLIDGTVAVEYKFEFDLGIPHPDIPGATIKYKGLLDMLAEQRIDRDTIVLCLVDEKTTASVSRLAGTKDKSHPNGLPDIEKMVNSYRTDSQLLGYHWAARELGVNTTKGLIRKVPILTDHEDAFELVVPVNQWQIDIWYRSTIDRIVGLAARYNEWKKDIAQLPSEYFLPVLNGYSCTSFGQPCAYMDGCLSKHGEAMLASNFEQLVWDSETKEQVPLEQFKKRIGI